MDIILLSDIEKLGTEGSVVRVKPGFARNYLMPRGLAVLATPEQLKVMQELKRRRQKKNERVKSKAEALKRKLDVHSLTLKLTVGVDDKPFGSVTAHDIAEVLRQDGLAIEKHMIQLEEPVKTLGVFEVPLRLHSEVTAILKVRVVKA